MDPDADRGVAFEALSFETRCKRLVDVLSEMLGRDQAEGLVTEKPCIRVDIKLSARAPSDNPLPTPSKAAWTFRMNDD